MSRTVDVLTADVDTALKAIDLARAAARATVWGLAGEHAPDHSIDAVSPLTVDVDATLVAHDEVRDGAWVAELTGLLDLTGLPTGMRVIARKEQSTPARSSG